MPITSASFACGIAREEGVYIIDPKDFHVDPQSSFLGMTFKQSRVIWVSTRDTNILIV